MAEEKLKIYLYIYKRVIKNSSSMSLNEWALDVYIKCSEMLMCGS